MPKRITGHERAVLDWAAKLAHGAKTLLPQLHRYPSMDSKSKINLDRVLEILDQDFARIEDAHLAAKNGKWPPGMMDADVPIYLAAIQRARLATFQTAVAFWVCERHAAGTHSKTLTELVQALDSIQTGAGKKQKWFQAVRVQSDGKEPRDVEVLARLIALATLVDDRTDRLRELYDAAEKEGLERRAARRAVDNFRTGQLKGEMLKALINFWYTRFKTAVEEGQSLHQLLCDPYGRILE